MNRRAPQASPDSNGLFVMQQRNRTRLFHFSPSVIETQSLTAGHKPHLAAQSIDVAECTATTDVLPIGSPVDSSRMPHQHDRPSPARPSNGQAHRTWLSQTGVHRVALTQTRSSSGTHKSFGDAWSSPQRSTSMNPVSINRFRPNAFSA